LTEIKGSSKKIRISPKFYGKDILMINSKSNIKVEELIIIPKREYDVLKKKALRWDTYLEYETIVEVHEEFVD